MGKGKKPGENDAEQHVSRPLAALKDPSQFGPPPKNVNYHGGAALPNQITPHRDGWGAPLSQDQIQNARAPAQEEVEEEEEKPKGPPVPYRADRTGLQTNNFAPPPVHRALAASPAEAEVGPAKPKPGLPPRLPARKNTQDAASPMSPPPPAYEPAAPQPQPPTPSNGMLNKSSLSRLGNAGVSVPGLGIGRSTNNTTTTSTSANPWSNERSQSTTSPPPSNAAGGNSQLSELQSRFSRMTSSSSVPKTTTPAPTDPNSTPPLARPTLGESQSALRTASQLHTDPSKISLSDAQSAAATAQSGARNANAFKEKHADKFNAASTRAKSFENKYKVKHRFENFLDKHAPLEGEEGAQAGAAGGGVGQGLVQNPAPSTTQGGAPTPQATPELAASIGRKPPPPPPPKKPRTMHGNATAAAPPVPVGTKPLR